MKNTKKIGKPDRKIPVPTDNVVIVLTGLVHEETGRQFVQCTDERWDFNGFLLSPEDMGSPDGGNALAARCEHCKTEAGEAKTHWIVDFKTALLEGRVDVEEGGFWIGPLSLIQGLFEVREARRGEARKAVAS